MMYRRRLNMRRAKSQARVRLAYDEATDYYLPYVDTVLGMASLRGSRV